jgi:DNA-binding transcriptional ArsR family regulator
VKETRTPLAELLFPAQYRRKALALLLLAPEREMHVREIARVTGSSPGTMKKELDQLERAGLLKRRRVGNQVQFSANTDHPVFPDLAGLLMKSAGLADVLANALAPLADLVDIAFVFGSVARATERAASDVDVAIIGAVEFGAALNALHPAESVLQREINPAIYGRSEWAAQIASKSVFIQEILAKPKIFVIGTQHDLDQLGQSAEVRPT